MSYTTEDRYYSDPNDPIVPSQATRWNWLQCVIDGEEDDETPILPEDKKALALEDVLTGKWLLYRKDFPATDALWPLLKVALFSGLLGVSMKTSTPKQSKDDDDETVTCVYTKDWRDIEDIRRVLVGLREVTRWPNEKLYYKPDEMTLMGLSGSVYYSPRDDLITVTKKGHMWFDYKGLPPPKL